MHCMLGFLLLVVFLLPHGECVGKSQKWRMTWKVPRKLGQCRISARSGRFGGIPQPSSAIFIPKTYNLHNNVHPRINYNFIRFTMHTTARPRGTFVKVGDLKSFHKAKYRKNRGIKVLIPSMKSENKFGAMNIMIREYLKHHRVNVLYVDWSECPYGDPAKTDAAIPCSNMAANGIVTMLYFLNRYCGLKYSRVHMIGHCMGAHVAGFAGYEMRQRPIARITALDPTRQLFETASSHTEIVDANDASFVDVIHSSLLQGLLMSVGDADFYPNRANNHPGCGAQGFCQHIMSMLYFIDTIDPSNVDKYKGRRCDSVNDALVARCYGRVAMMGNSASPRYTGIYFVRVMQPAQSLREIINTIRLYGSKQMQHSFIL